MNKSVSDALERDVLLRWKVMGLAIAVTALTGYFSESLGSSPGEAEALSVMVGGFYFWGYAIFATSRKRMGRKARSQRASKSRNWSLPSKIPAAVGLALLLLLLLVPTLKAAVLNHRLEVLLSKPSSAAKSAETANVLKIAERSHTKLRADLVETAKKQVVQAPQSGTANQVVRDTPRYPYTGSAPWSSYVSSVASQFNSRNPRSGYTSSHSQLITIQIENRTITYTDFGDASVVYEGGPTFIHHLCFGYVELHIIENENGRKLLNAFKDSNDGCISVEIERPDFVSDGKDPQTP